MRVSELLFGAIDLLSPFFFFCFDSGNTSRLGIDMDTDMDGILRNMDMDMDWNGTGRIGYNVSSHERLKVSWGDFEFFRTRFCSRTVLLVFLLFMEFRWRWEDNGME